MGWNWDFRQTQELEIPKYSVIPAPQITDDNTLGLHFDYSIPAATGANTPTSVIDDNNSVMNNPLLHLPGYPPALLSASRDMVLHPVFSRYVAANPDYNIFSQTELPNNGYTKPTPMDTTDDGTSDISTSSNFSWLSNCNSLSSEAARELFDYYTHMPIVSNNFVTSVDDIFGPANNHSPNITATDIAGQMFPAIRSDTVSA